MLQKLYEKIIKLVIRGGNCDDIIIEKCYK